LSRQWIPLSDIFLGAIGCAFHARAQTLHAIFQAYAPANCFVNVSPAPLSVA
jgi:hypothetical protein